MKTKKSFAALVILMILPFGIFAQSNQSETLKKIVINEPFSKIIASGAFQLSIEQGDQQSISFQNNPENEVVYSIENETLKVKSVDGKVFMKVKNISMVSTSDALNVSSIGTLTTPNLVVIAKDASVQDLTVACENINIVTNDAAKLTVSGKAQTLTFSAHDASKINAIHLESDNVKANLNNVSTAWVNGKESVVGFTNDISLLYYLNEPKTINIQSKDASRSEKTDMQTAENNANEYPVDSLSNLVTDILIEIDSSFTDGTQKGKSDWMKNPFIKKHFDGNWGGLMLGFNNFVNSNNKMEVPIGYEYLDLNFAGSRTFALNLLEQNFTLIDNKLGITTGIGFQWYNYRFAKNAQLYSNKSAIDGTIDTANVSIYKKSKLGYTMLNIPLLLEFQTNPNHNRKSFHINAGVIFGVRLSSWTKTIIDDGATTKIETSDDFNLNPIRLDATVGIGYGFINLFASYSLTPLFKDKEGPRLYPVSAGIYLMLW